ncbi:hypothetical protein [Listeria welshimeri]|uniref:hypothetical protein n=1 Tax=Listeria welshimeri TaxID=1643 RepID=UPI001887EA3D|nr:hypothetical protein [Listeria welshimeri]MBF2613176.1 hypothetical protein [Listeria welshimeri]
MGCDIHLMVEVKDKETMIWEEYDVADKLLNFIGRNYKLFSILADVRNGVGFANVDIGDKFVPIDYPRGIPKDASQSYLAYVEDFAIDGHSHSFFNLVELKEFDWYGQKNKHRGFMSQEVYTEYKRTGEIVRYVGGVSGANIKKISNQVMEEIIKNKSMPDKEETYYTNVEWEQSYYISAASFVDNVIPALEKISEDFRCSNEEVRIVFFFDD